MKGEIMDNKKVIIEQLVRKYSNMLLQIAYHNTVDKEEAKDIVQDVFVKFMESNRDYNDENHIRAWLIRVTINLCNNYNKSAWKRKRSLYELNDFSFEDEDRLLIQDLYKLAPKYRNVLYLHYYMGYTINEIAQIMKKNQGTISSWLRRGRSKMKQELEGGGNNE